MLRPRRVSSGDGRPPSLPRGGGKPEADIDCLSSRHTSTQPALGDKRSREARRGPTRRGTSFPSRVYCRCRSFTTLSLKKAGTHHRGIPLSSASSASALVTCFMSHRVGTTTVTRAYDGAHATLLAIEANQMPRKNHVIFGMVVSSRVVVRYVRKCWIGSGGS